MLSKVKFSFLIIIMSFFAIQTNGQNKKSEWVAGLSLASAKFTDNHGKVLGGSFIKQSPRINVSKYLFKNFSADVGFSTAIFDTQKYTTFDAVLRYDFGTSMDNVVPYVVIGGSFISAVETTPTLNLGAGNTFWIKENYGVNVQVVYKYSEDRFESQYSHFYPTIGVVYSFKPRNLNPRLWHMNN